MIFRAMSKPPCLYIYASAVGVYARHADTVLLKHASTYAPFTSRETIKGVFGFHGYADHYYPRQAAAYCRMQVENLETDRQVWPLLAIVGCM
jgi:hypothetical protein